MTAKFGVDTTGAFAVMGTMDGFTARVKTPFYINSVLSYAHKRLSDYFDLYLDNVARDAPRNFQHVYEWPQKYHNYKETVGIPAYRLWMHTLQGKSAQAQASFQFLPSTRPTPVNPILLEAGPGGRKVKTGVHVFVWKTRVMEYGLPVEITPKLSRYLAYVISATKGQGTDNDPLRHPNKPEDEGGNVMLSKGPVNIDHAGGSTTQGKFTEAFLGWYSTLAPVHMRDDILPQVEKDLAATVKLQMAQNAKSSIKSGLSKSKSLGIAGQASANSSAFEGARREVEAALTQNSNKYIREAASRRAILYGNS